MWLFITGLILVALTWVGGLLLRSLHVLVPIWVLVALTAAIVVGCIAIALLRRLRARMAARKLERELLAQAESGPEAPARQAEIVELRVQLEKGVRALKQSRLGAKGRDSLYTLPWYIIVGPPGAGKTTALKHSGLNFPFLDPRDQGGIKGVGGTRNCDWWFTNEAVLLDTAGRYATQDDDRVEWFAFLDLLRRYRKKKPINGVMLAVSVVDLLEGNEEQNAQLAQTLRARIDELQTRLDMVVPVYVTFTKTDLVAGFTEFFADLKKSERDQVLGATCDLEESVAGRSVAQFDQDFDTLVERVQARAVRRIGNERGETERSRIFQFPLEFRALKAPVQEFLSTLFEDTGVGDNPLFRGFYFTSGTQEGSPVDRVIGGIARAFGLAEANIPPAHLEPKSFFVTNLFRSVMFPDQGIAARTRRERRRQFISRAAFAAAMVALSLVVLSAPSCSFSHNMKLVRAARDTSADAGRIAWNGAENIPAKAKKLDTLRKQLQLLDTWDKEGPPSRLRWGMYVGEDLHPALRDVYIRSIERGLKQPASTNMRNRLRALSVTAVDTHKRYQTAYDLLKLYLMTSWPEKLQPKWAAPRLTHVWMDALHSSHEKRDEAALEPDVLYYLQLMKRGQVKRWSRDAGVVSRMRTQLLRTPQLDRLYAALVRDANETIDPIRHKDIFFGAVAPYVTYAKDVQIDGAYTKPGWALVKKRLGDESAWSGEAWVLGEGHQTSTKQIKAQLAKLRTLYFERYKEAWRNFFTDIRIHQPENAQTALNELTSLSEPEWAYQRLLKKLADNATLDVSSGKLSGKAKSLIQKGLKEAKRKFSLGEGGSQKAEGKPISPVERAFKPLIKFGVAPPPPKGQKKAQTGLDTYEGTLAKLIASLTDLRDGAPSPDPSKVGNDFQTAYRATSAQLATQTGYTRPMLSPLLMRPISFAWSGVVHDAGSAASGLWETEVWSKWQAKLKGRYPFKDSPDDASLADFTAFFQPGKGALWKFYNTNLKGSLKRDGDTFLPIRRFRSSMAYAPDFLGTCMKRGADITDTLFDGNASPGVDFEVNLHTVSRDVSQVGITIDGASHTYQNYPAQWLKAHWPAKKSKDRGASVAVLGYRNLDEQIMRKGDFGFYRLLDAASSIKQGTAGGRPNGEPTLVVTWKLRTRDAFISVDIRSSKDDNSLNSSLFKDYTCPRVITH